MSKKKIKENPLMKSKKANGIKGNASEEGNEIKSFIIIIIVLVIIVGAIYGITALLSNKESDYTYEVKDGEINYNKVIVGTLLNRPYNEYYVLVYNSEDLESSKYSALMSNYMQKSSDKDYIKIYFCDLNNKLNQEYYNVNNDDKSNPKASKISELDFGDLTLLHIKKGKITEYIEDYKTIQEKLK